MTAATLLARLQKVRQRGADRWSARCPAHEDKSPSLSIRQLPDGRVLVHCFGGCGVADVLTALGFEMDALFPKRGSDGNRAPRERRPFQSDDALQLIEYELFFVVACARKLIACDTLDPDEHERLLLAVSRISGARQACGLEAA